MEFEEIVVCIFYLGGIDIMKDKVKGLVLGLAIGTMITGSTAFAATNTKLNVALENVKYMFDGVQKSTVQSIIYNGSLYVPAKTMAQGMGKDFTYDGKNKTAWVGSKQGSFKYLSDIDYARKDGRSDINFDENSNGDSISIAGNQFKKGITTENLDWYANQESIDYNTNSKYKSFSGYVGVEDYSKNSTTTLKISFICDDNEVSSFELKGGDNPKLVNVDLTGVLKFRIVFELEGKDSLDDTIGAVGEAKLFQ